MKMISSEKNSRNKIKDDEIHGDYVGHDNINVNIVLF